MPRPKYIYHTTRLCIPRSLAGSPFILFAFGGRVNSKVLKMKFQLQPANTLYCMCMLITEQLIALHFRDKSDTMCIEIAY